jgi:hypothetical protein
MKKNNGIEHLPTGDCSGLSCHLGIIFDGGDDDPTNDIYGCLSGGGDCGEAIIQDAVNSDEAIQKATMGIRAILELMPAGPEGSNLSVILANKGFFLAWVKHAVEIPKGAKVITQKDNPKEFLKRLKLKKPKTTK